MCLLLAWYVAVLIVSLILLIGLNIPIRVRVGLRQPLSRRPGYSDMSVELTAIIKRRAVAQFK